MVYVIGIYWCGLKMRMVDEFGSCELLEEEVQVYVCNEETVLRWTEMK